MACSDGEVGYRTIIYCGTQSGQITIGPEMEIQKKYGVLQQQTKRKCSMMSNSPCDADNSSSTSPEKKKISESILGSCVVKKRKLLGDKTKDVEAMVVDNIAEIQKVNQEQLSIPEAPVKDSDDESEIPAREIDVIVVDHIAESHDRNRVLVEDGDESETPTEGIDVIQVGNIAENQSRYPLVGCRLRLESAVKDSDDESEIPVREIDVIEVGHIAESHDRNRVLVEDGDESETPTEGIDVIQVGNIAENQSRYPLVGCRLRLESAVKDSDDESEIPAREIDVIEVGHIAESHDRNRVLVEDGDESETPAEGIDVIQVGNIAENQSIYPLVGCRLRLESAVKDSDDESGKPAEEVVLKEGESGAVETEETKDSQIDDNVERLEKENADKTDKIMMSVIREQKLKGNWDLTQRIADLLKMSMEQIRSAVSLKDDSTVCTLVIVAWLRKVFPKTKDEWQLIETKAVIWLETQDLEGKTVQEHLKSCTTNLWP